MATLKEQLGAQPKRAEVIKDAILVLDAEVAEKRGISGMAVKGAYKLVKGVKPGFTEKAVDKLLDDFLDALDPFYTRAIEAGVTPGDYVAQHKTEVAEALLTVTDGKVQKAENRAIQKTYGKLRGSAASHVEAAAPRLGEMLARHAS